MVQAYKDDVTVQGKMFRFPCQSLDVALEVDYRRKNTRQANHCIS